MTPQFRELQKSIAKSGTLRHSRADFLKLKSDMFGKSDTATIGKPPPGFGPTVEWKAEDEKIAVVLFLSAADFMGAMISGVTKFDTIDIVSAVGIASFSEDIENEGIASFIGVLAAGAQVTTAIFGAPEFAPVIEAGEKFAKEQFKEEKVKTKRRDPFGVDPGTGHKARQEGGVAISLPNGGIGQAFYSGEDSTEAERWIKKPGDRTHKNLPEHMKGKAAFFLQGGVKNREQVRHHGDILIYPWDHAFQDNFGFYRLSIILERLDQSLFDEDVE